MQDRQLFIDKLIQKLKSGDARSIHLNALPGRYARLDLHDLKLIEPGLANEFLKKLLSGQPFSFNIKIEATKYSLLPTEERKAVQRIIKRLNTLYYQEQDEYAEHGTLSFGFGYPLLIQKDPANPARILKAPLLIWHLQIDRHTQHSNTWTIRRTEDQAVLFNEVYTTHMENTSGVKWPAGIHPDEEEDFTATQLEQLCKSVLAALDIEAPEKILQADIQPCSDKEQIERTGKEKTYIRWSGVFGLYKTQKQPIIQDLLTLQQLAGNQETAPQPGQVSSDHLSPVALDPSQETVLHDLNLHKRIIIQGPPGTGKSQSLTAVITNALLDGQKVLVVCEKRTALEVIKNNLEQFGLGQLIALIEDVYADRNTVVQAVRQLMETSGDPEHLFRQHQYAQVKTAFLQQRGRINDRVQALYQRSFGDDNWLTLANRQIALSQQIGLRALQTELSEEDPEISYAWWLQLRQALHHDQALLSRTAPLLTAINLLPVHWWLSPKDPEWIDSVRDLAIQIRELLQLIEQYSESFGEEYLSLTGRARFKTGLLGLFSDRQKSIKAARTATIERYQKIFNTAQLLQWPEHPFTSPEERSSIQPWKEQLQAVTNQADHAATVAPQIVTVQTWLNNAATQPPVQQKLWEALCPFPEQEREMVLEEWLLRKHLAQYAETHQLPADGEHIMLTLKESEDQLKPLLAEKILDTWQRVAQSLASAQDATHKRMLYNLRRNKKYASKNTLRTILQNDFEYFTSVFPVLMVNPVAASSILPMQKDLFDLVILDEASQLRIEDTFSALYRGKMHVISGDEHQMPPSSYFSADAAILDETEDIEEEKDLFLAQSASLLEYAGDAGYHPTYLDFHYRSRHPDLIAFSNAGFYGSRLVPMPPCQAYQAIHFRQVDGTYKDGVNHAEAQAIVQFLYDYAARHEDKMPGIGIGTLNIQQRDLVQDLLWEQAHADPHKNHLMEQMMKAGLFIKNLENIQGDERDVIIIGTTFGKDEDGKFRQNFGPLNRQNGYQLLNVLITRAKVSMHVFCSVPENIYQNFEEELRQNGNTGKALLYAYISYVKATAEQNTDKKRYILNLLKDNNNYTARKNSRPVRIPPYVSNALKRQGVQNLQEQVSIGGFILEGCIYQQVKKPIYLQVERPSSHTQVHYRELLYRENILKQYNIQNYRIWSYNWWKQQQEEVDKFKSILDRLSIEQQQ